MPNVKAEPQVPLLQSCTTVTVEAASQFMQCYIQQEEERIQKRTKKKKKKNKQSSRVVYGEATRLLE